MIYCATLLHRRPPWWSIRHERFESTLPIPPGFVLTIRCQICGDYMSLGAANDRVPRDEMRLAEATAKGGGQVTKRQRAQVVELLRCAADLGFSGVAAPLSEASWRVGRRSAAVEYRVRDCS